MQVYRKIWHLSFIWAPIVYYHFFSYAQAILLSLLFLLLFLAVDIIRLNWKRGNEIAYRHFSWLLREQERKGLNTAFYFALSCLICAVFFEKRVAVTAIALLCVGDPIAAIIGTRYGSIRILNKSLQGSLACFIVCFAVARFMFDSTLAFWAALTATFFELISSRLNDNLSVPIFSGLMLTFLFQPPEIRGPMQYLLRFLDVYLLFVVATSFVGIGIKHYILHTYIKHYPASFRARAEAPPSVSIIKPLAGLEGGDYENLSSFCRLVCAGPWELVFVVKDGTDPVLKVIDRLRLEFTGVDIRVVFSGPGGSIADKMNKLIQGVRRARGNVLIFSDAAVRVPPDYLERVTAPLADPEIGMVTAVASYFGARTIPAALNAHLVNLLGQSLYFTLAFFDRLETANGCTIAVRREVLEQVGGFSGISHQVSESHALAQAIHRKGYRILLLDRMIPVHHARLPWTEWLERMHRMVVIYRTYVPHSYPLFLFQLGLLHALVYWWMHPLSVVGPILAGASLVAETLSHLRMNYLYVKDRSTYFFIWLLPLLLVVAPLIWASPYFSRVVCWRGQRFFVDRTGVATRLKEISAENEPKAADGRVGRSSDRAGAGRLEGRL
ncbi:MAG: glycosyltransferase [bacterium]